MAQNKFSDNAGRGVVHLYLANAAKLQPAIQTLIQCEHLAEFLFLDVHAANGAIIAPAPQFVGVPWHVLQGPNDTAVRTAQGCVGPIGEGYLVIKKSPAKTKKAKTSSTSGSPHHHKHTVVKIWGHRFKRKSFQQRPMLMSGHWNDANTNCGFYVPHMLW